MLCVCESKVSEKHATGEDDWLVFWVALSYTFYVDK